MAGLSHEFGHFARRFIAGEGFRWRGEREPNQNISAREVGKDAVESIVPFHTKERLTMPDEPYVITISHQLGAGGAYLGNKLSKRLGLPFIDRDILKQVAAQLNLSEADLEQRDERLSSFWESF